MHKFWGLSKMLRCKCVQGSRKGALLLGPESERAEQAELRGEGRKEGRESLERNVKTGKAA